MNIQQKYRIISFSTSETKMKKTMGNLTLETLAGKETVNAKIWEDELVSYEKRFFKPNNIIFVDEGTYNEQYKNLVIKKLSLCEEAPSGLNAEQREAAYLNLIEVINNIKNENLRQAVSDMYKNNEKLMKIAPAAKNNHHNYIGGLMVHTTECVKIAKNLFGVTPQKIDEDLIIAACLMHDFGKIFEYTIDTETGFVEVNEEFLKTWVSHTLYGFSWANQNGFVELARVIAAHHSRKDWGAIIDLDEKNVEPHMYLMHHIDDISAKFGVVKAELL